MGSFIFTIKKAMKISALAITLNEAENVKRYIESLSFVDEILFIDSYSTDETKAIAEQYGARVIQRRFDNFSNQRNFAISQAKNDWIVFFDLDEIITKEVEKEIIEQVHTSNDYVAYYAHRNVFLFNKRIKYGGLQNDKAIRLFNKNYCTYNGHLVHEEIKVSGKIGHLKNRVDHHSFKSFDHYFCKLNQYSELKANECFNKNKKATVFHFIVRPSYRFVWQYFYRLGFLDGAEGFLSAKINAFFVFKRYVTLWNLNKKTKATEVHTIPQNKHWIEARL